MKKQHSCFLNRMKLRKTEAEFLVALIRLLVSLADIIAHYYLRHS
jgi:hypothetical protein